MVKQAWLALMAAKKEALLNDAIRRSAGGSGTRMGAWLAAIGIVALATMSAGGSWSQWGAGACALMAAWAWRDSKKDNSRWSSAEKARESEKKAWFAARRSQSALEASRIEASAREPGTAKAPRRL